MKMQHVEKLINYSFEQPSLLEEALTHPSLGQTAQSGSPYNYERLEFLGDAVLGMVIAQMLMMKYPTEQEGELAKRQAALVKGDVLTDIAQLVDLGSYINMSSGEESTGGRKNKRNLENTLEAIIGAIYLDGGLEAVSPFIERFWLSRLEVMAVPPKDPKTRLQEWAQKQGYPVPEYKVVEHSGPSHEPSFTIEVFVKDCPKVTGVGASKKAAEKIAAKALLKKIQS
jgi:ribonuclease-3